MYNHVMYRCPFTSTIINIFKSKEPVCSTANVSLQWDTIAIYFPFPKYAKHNPKIGPVKSSEPRA